MHILYQGGDKEERLSGDKTRAVILDDSMRTLLREFKHIVNDIQKSASETCVFNEDEQKTVKHACGMLSDVGDSNTSGVEKARDSIKFVESRQNLEKDIGKKALYVIITGILVAILSIFWDGFINSIKAVVGK
jgi:hypothetical protein